MGIKISLALLLLVVIILPLNLLVSQPLHHDEALYATWALQIISGRDPWLTRTPVDKPPLFLYTLAGMMALLGVSETTIRLPSLLATVAIVGLTFKLGQRLYDPGIGLLAAWLVALSPFTILFAPTAFTDPLLVALVMAGCLAAIQGRAAWAGVSLGLAVATKQQGLFFVPLVMAFLVGMTFSPRLLARFLLGFAPVLLLVLAWNSARGEAPGFLEQSLVNYGGLLGNPAGFGWRWVGFIQLLQYFTGAPLLNGLFLVGLPILLLGESGLVRFILPGCWAGEQTYRAEAFSPLFLFQPDWLLFFFSLLFLLGHSLLSFQVWDRYLLGLVPLLALLLARVLLWPWQIIQNYLSQKPAGRRWWASRLAGLVLTLLLVGTMFRPVHNAVHARYPLGSNSGAMAGINQIVAYLRGQVGANHTLYHHWLGTHWRFYLWDYPYDLQYWSSPQDLAVKARPGHLIAFPSWQSDTEARLALAETGLTLQEVIRVYHPAGYSNIILYRIKPLVPAKK